MKDVKFYADFYTLLLIRIMKMMKTNELQPLECGVYSFMITIKLAPHSK